MTTRQIQKVCRTVENSPNPSSVYIRLCKHGKRFLLLKYRSHIYFNFWTIFPLNNRQPSKLEKIYHQRSRLPPHETASASGFIAQFLTYITGICFLQMSVSRIGEKLGNLSNDDGDVNENGKK